MKFTLRWLKDHLDTEASLETIVDTLSMIGLEVEGVEDPSLGLESFRVARVLEASPHPNAERLRVCRVDTGAGEFQVVCGAPNARTGLIGVFAAEGAYIPGTQMTLKRTEIRGVESCGMLLSEREMGLSDDHEGIVELADDAPVGASAIAVMGLDDPLIDIAITPNRGDCLGVRGVARDLAAAGLGELKPLSTTPVSGTYHSPVGVALNLPEDAASACPYFVGRHLRGVRNRPSPKWLQERLRAIGLRPISALVDITNFLTFDLGRPAHVFDAAKVDGDIQVRLAQPGERLLALNEKDYELDDTMTVIADQRVAEAIAGVIGGAPSGCTEATTEVFLEIAYFDPVRTATTGRKLNVQTDARYRFERGVDPAFLVEGAEIATRMILELCGGEASHLVIAGTEPQWRREVEMRADRVASLGGVDLPAAQIDRILTTVGCEVSRRGEGAQQVVVAVPPPWRPDIASGIEGEAGLVEEVLRLHGFDKIPAVSAEVDHPVPTPALTAAQRRRSLTRRTLASRGLVEAVTYSFLPLAHAEMFGGGQDNLRLVNPISSDLDVMRPSLLPNLIMACARNAARGLSAADLFEVGPQYGGDAPEDQITVAAGVRSGMTGPRHWATPPRAVDAFDAKADVVAVLRALGVPVDRAQISAEAPAWYHPGRSGTLRLGPKTVLAHFGEIHPRVLRALDVATTAVVAFEVMLDNLPQPKGKKGAAKPLLTLSPLQPVARDFAFVVDHHVAADDLLRAAQAADKTLISDAAIFDVFTGSSLGEGRKSIALTVTLQPQDKTLTDTEIEAISQRVVSEVVRRTGAQLRG